MSDSGEGPGASDDSPRLGLSGAPDWLESQFPQAIGPLRQYASLLIDPGISWGVLGPAEAPRIWERHICNSLAPVDFLPAESTVLDVGSGAGLPGWPLALARPDLTVTLLEPQQRRRRFLALCAEQLARPDVDIQAGRAQDLRRTFDVVTARAVAPLAELVPMVAQLVADGGLLVALKGDSAQAEIDEACETGVLAGGWEVELRRAGRPETNLVLLIRS